MRLAFLVALCALSAGCIMASDGSRGASACAAVDEYCAKDPSGGDACLLRMSRECANPGLCGKIKNREFEYRCRLLQGEYDPLLCGGIANDSVRYECYGVGADLRGDVKLCDRIDDRVRNDMCRANVAYKTADRRLCNPVLENNRREFCFAVADRDGTICANLIDEDLRMRCVEWTMKKLPKV